MVRNHAEVSDAQIGKLLGTTKNTIRSIRENTHWNSPNIRPRDPVMLGLCTQVNLNETVERAAKKAPRGTAKKPAAVETPAVDTPAVETPAIETPAVEAVADEAAAAETPS